MTHRRGRGCLPGFSSAARRVPTPGAPRAQGARPARPCLAREGALRSLGLHSATGAASSAKGAWSGAGYLGAILQRLLQQKLVHGGHGAARPGRGSEERTERGRRGRRECSRPKRQEGRSVPARPRPVGGCPPASPPLCPVLAEPEQQEVWRTPGRATGSVAAPLLLRPRLAGSLDAPGRWEAVGG